MASFHIDPFETTQAEWEAVMGFNPGTFIGENLPVENISWLDAIQYANARSEAAGLTPVYAIDGEFRRLGPRRGRLPPAHGGGVGVRLPRGYGHALQPGAFAGCRRRQLLRTLPLRDRGELFR